MPQVSDPAGNVAIARANVSGHPQASFGTLTNQRPLSFQPTIAFDAAEELPSGLVGGFEPIACHVATTVYSGTAEIDVVAVACAA
jgi:hypothetical protein